MAQSEADEFDTWRRAASKYAPALHLDADDLIARHNEVFTVLGKKWLLQQRAILQRGAAFHELHPLYSLLRSSAEIAIVEVAEIGEYVRTFETDAAFNDVLAHLRTTRDFRAAVFELAMAFRWSRAGAKIRLAPSLPSGRRADFSAEIEGVNYTVEVSSSPREMLNEQAAGYAKAIMKTLHSAKCERNNVAIELVIEQQLKGDLQGAVQRTVREGLKRISSVDQVLLDLPFGTVLVRRTSADVDDCPNGRWHHSQQLILKEPPADGAEFEAHKERTIGRGCAVHVRLPPKERDLYDILLSKYRREITQLSGVSDRVILLDLSGVKTDVLNMDMDRVNDTLGQELLRDGKTSAAWIVSRGWSEYLRPMYRAITISNPNAVHPVPPAFGHHAGDLEEGFDMLTGKAYDWRPTRRFEDPLL